MNSEKFIKVCTILIINFFRAHSDKLRLYGAGAAFFARSRSGPKLAGVISGPQTFGAAQKIGGSATRNFIVTKFTVIATSNTF